MFHKSVRRDRGEIRHSSCDTQKFIWKVFTLLKQELLFNGPTIYVIENITSICANNDCFITTKCWNNDESLVYMSYREFVGEFRIWSWDSGSVLVGWFVQVSCNGGTD
jgi:hypothetical protein